MKKYLLCLLAVFVCLPGLSHYSAAEELSVTLTPVYSPYWKRTTPWTSEEKILIQGSISGIEASNAYTTRVHLLKDGIVKSTYSQRHTSPVKIEKLFSNFYCGPLNPGNHSMQVSIEDEVSGKTAKAELAFEVRSPKDLYLRDLALVDYETVLHPIPPVCFAHQNISFAFMYSGAVQDGDILSATISDKKSSEILCKFESVYSPNLHYISFSLKDPGKHILLLKAVNKTNNQEVEYELPIFVVDPAEIYNKGESDNYIPEGR